MRSRRPTRRSRIAERFGDADLFALVAQAQGHVLILDGRVKEALPLLDEAMVAVANGELSPVPSGLVYCGVILACQLAYELRRAREWTAALSDWCAAQPDMVAFTGRCGVHRTEILGLGGAWPEALAEAQEASRRCMDAENPRAAGEADVSAGRPPSPAGPASPSPRRRTAGPGSRGCEPQPGLALLRAAQGNTGAARTALRRALAEATDPSGRARVLPALAEIELAAGDLDASRAAGDETAEIAAAFDSPLLDAMAARAEGALQLAGGAAEAALPSLRRAAHGWQELDAPYELARTRELLARACLALGDGDAARMELDAARETYAALGAAPDLARLDAPPARRPPRAQRARAGGPAAGREPAPATRRSRPSSSSARRRSSAT